MNTAEYQISVFEEMYRMTITVDGEDIKTDTSDMDVMLACLAGLEQHILDISNYDDSAYEKICAITSGIVFDETFADDD